MTLDVIQTKPTRDPSPKIQNAVAREIARRYARPSYTPHVLSFLWHCRDRADAMNSISQLKLTCPKYLKR